MGGAGGSGTAGGSGGSSGNGGTSGAAGSAGEPTAGGTDGAAGEASTAGASSEGGTPNEPTVPGASACGAQKYETGDGCDDCPALPSPNYPTTLDCQSYTRAYKINEDLELAFAEVPFHEPLGGTVTVEWSDDLATSDGTAEVTWEYSPSDDQFFVDLPFEARYADHWRFGTWTFADVCGFLFTAPGLVVDYDGEAYRCVPPT